MDLTNLEPTKKGMDGTIFYEKHHRFRNKSGKFVPSVTKHLCHLGFINYSGIDEYYRDRGTRVHKIVEMDQLGRLNPETILDDEKGYYEAFKSWKAEWQDALEFAGSEVILSNNLFGGIIDSLYKYKGTDDVVIVDWKTSKSLPGWVKYQLEGYATLLNGIGVYPKERRIVQLKNDGTYTETVYGNEHAETWRKLVLVARQFRPVEQKKFLAHLICMSPLSLDGDYVGTAIKQIDEFKKSEKLVESAKEIVKAKIEKRTGIGEDKSGKTLHVVYQPPKYGWKVNMGAFWGRIESELDDATIRVLRKYWSESREYVQTRAGYHEFKVLDTTGENIDFTHHVNSTRTAEEIADYIRLYHADEHICRYMAMCFGKMWTRHHVNKYGGDVRKLIIGAVNDCRKILSNKELGGYYAS